MEILGPSLKGLEMLNLWSKWAADAHVYLEEERASDMVVDPPMMLQSQITTP